MNNNSKEIIVYFEKALELLQGIKDGTTAMNKEQQKENENLEEMTAQ